MYLLRLLLVLLGLRRRVILVICSQTFLKVEGFKKAFRRLGIPVKVLTIKSPSGVADQPIGDDETQAGAKGRLVYAQEHINGNVYCSGESGLVYREKIWVDEGFLLFHTQKFEASGWTAPLELPHEVVEEVLSWEGRVTIGQVLREKGKVKNAQDPHVELSGVSRLEFYANTAYSVLLPHKKALLAFMRK